MKLFVPAALFLASLASAQTVRTTKTRVATGSAASLTGSSLSQTPVPSALSAPSLSAAPSLAVAPALAAAPAILPAAALGAPPIPVVPSKRLDSPALGPSADANHTGGAALGALSDLAVPSRRAPSGAPSVDDGRRVFDGGEAARAEALAPAVSAADASRLARSTARESEPRAKIPFKQRAAEAVELGAFGLGMQLITGLVFLVAGAHAAFPALAGALWVLGGSEGVKHLADLRRVLVGGWQASHDQKMRVDYGTGRLKDIRGHKYGEDRYDEFAPGPVSARERLVIDSAALAAGLPWVWGAGPKAVALYAAAAVSVIAARQVWRRLRPVPEPKKARPGFQYDR
ncbi:MAG: hypothetical protein HYV14_10935 [Elusimicrobia bacterium]|nr:hypothetical protein [Elusimicrobiota bacterium]